MGCFVCVAVFGLVSFVLLFFDLFCLVVGCWVWLLVGVGWVWFELTCCLAPYGCYFYYEDVWLLWFVVLIGG